ncbi:MAG: type transport system permease protein [Gaiellaceae bacterium]|nr:type transport system permease protein [Gaiellaceae bacterium]
MIRLVNAELMKLRTTRATFWLLAALAFGIFLSVLLIGLLVKPSALDSVDNQQGLLGPGIVVPLFALVIGIIISTGEFRHGTITPTLLATPQRALVVGAKVVAGAIFGAILLVAGEALALAVAAFALAVRGIPIHLFDGRFWSILGGLLGACALGGALGAAIGTAFRNQSATLIVSILWLLVGENVLRGFFPGQASYLPGSALIAVFALDGGEALLHLWAGVAVALGYVALFTAAAWVLLSRRDVS